MTPFFFFGSSKTGSFALLSAFVALTIVYMLEERTRRSCCDMMRPSLLSMDTSDEYYCNYYYNKSNNPSYIIPTGTISLLFLLYPPARE